MTYSTPFLSSIAADTAAVTFIAEMKWSQTTNNPFHKGEIAWQQAVGAQKSVMSYAPQFIRPNLTDQHCDFYEQLPFLVAAARDEHGAMWATLLEHTTTLGDDDDDDSNNTNLVQTLADRTTMRIQALPVAGDALETAFDEKEPNDLGLLGIQFETKRRNRVNGRAVIDGKSLLFTVDQAFGNCPQYIKSRTDWYRTPTVSDSNGSSTDKKSKQHTSSSNRLTKNQMQWIESTETMFVASGYREDEVDRRHGNDASHRGGPPGFVRAIQDNEIVWTEFQGNNHFNTLGNILLDPRIGIAVPEFSTGSLLQVSGTATVEMETRNGLQQRIVRMRIAAVNELPAASLPIRWRADNDTGTAATQEKVLLKVSNIVQESVNVKSFYLKPVDDATPLWSFQGGATPTSRTDNEGRRSPPSKLLAVGLPSIGQ